MALIRFELDLAIPEAIYNALPIAKVEAFRNVILAMKSLAVKINKDLPSEEATITAVWHKCYHDEGKSCDPKQDI